MNIPVSPRCKHRQQLKRDINFVLANAKRNYPGINKTDLKTVLLEVLNDIDQQ